MAAIGLPREWGLGSLRLTLGVDTTAQQVESLFLKLPTRIAPARGLQRN
jgi:hypothetical protein